MEHPPHQSIVIGVQEPSETGSGPQQEREFYSFYDWCLNPIQTVRDLFDRLLAEIDRYNSLRLHWQRAEAVIALYLLSCAIGCTLDDYLSWNPFVLTPLTDAYPQLAFLFLATQKTLNLPYLLSSSRNIKAASLWRGGWMRFQERVCSLLLRDEELISRRAFLA